MSLDVYIYELNDDLENEPSLLYNANITHNLVHMADAAGIYYALWRPEEIGIDTSEKIIPVLELGLEKLKANPDYFKTFNSKNGWGLYENFVSFVENYLNACKEYPNDRIRVSR